MTVKAIPFVEDWVSVNIKAENLEVDEEYKMKTTASALAGRCVAAALAEGIPESEIRNSFEDLSAFMAGELREANDREVDRLFQNKSR